MLSKQEEVGGGEEKQKVRVTIHVSTSAKKPPNLVRLSADDG